MSHNGTVLVVDDDPKALALMMSVLEEEGYRVQPADSGRLALISVAAQRPELILLDVRMPGMDGFEVCRRIKETAEGRRVPIMFISASSTKQQWVEGLSLGAVDFVSKPFQREELLARVRTHIELARLEAELELRVARRTAELRNAIEQLQLEVAERRRAEEALRESEERFRYIANSAPCIIWTSGADNEVDFRSEYGSAFTGRTTEELMDDRWTEVVCHEDLERQQREFLQGLETRRSFQLEYRLRRADGQYRWMLDNGIPRFLPDGQFAGYFGTISDVTDLKRSQEKACAAQYLENLRVLSAGIAHDFNTLIGAIFGEVDLALSDMTPDAPGRENVERIGGVAKRAAGIVRLLLAYAGDQPASGAPVLVDLVSVVQELVPHLTPSIAKGAEIRTELPARLFSIRANLAQIRQVVLALIINGVEALDGQKGRVTVSASTVQIERSSTEDIPSDLPDGTYVRLEVSDTGRGMTEEVKARVFDPYYSTKFPGRGLGLAVVQGIIRSHKGSISVRSLPQGGSTFEVLLPSAANA
jgi:two-component system, cell cycle sensor histidine kinase and response regulator CckA